MQQRQCPRCREKMWTDCFRKGAKVCVWCAFKSMHKRAGARYGDKVKHERSRVNISKDKFVAWYEQQPDCCRYCGLTFDELRQLKIRRKGGYYVSWDIDRIDSARLYELGNLALSCFVCNMAKGEVLSGREVHMIGRAVRKIWNARIDAKK